MLVSQPDLNGTTRVLWTIPKTPPSLNVWTTMHWGQRRKVGEQWDDYAYALSRTTGLPQKCDWVYASAEIVFRKGAHRDLTNFSATLQKIFPDVLQRIGVLDDDTEKQMRWGPITMRVDKTLGGVYVDPRLQGMTRIAMIAKGRD
jgi:hypothetical protein